MERITDKEKLKLIMGLDWWQTNDLNGKIGRVRVNDGPVGVRCLQNTDSWTNATVLPSVAYPCYQMLSQTWNLALARKMGNAIADDCADFGVDIILGPGINIKRTPLCGRNFEYFSEDPYVAGTFGKAFIEGVQENHVGVSLKHFCGNNREYNRHWSSSEIDERTLREIYLKPFQIAVQANPWTVMCAYNLVNGVRMSEHKKLYTVLREEFGFKGVIVSDWEAVKDPLASLHAGLDLEMPYKEAHEKQMEKHLAAGQIKLDCLNQSAERILHLVETAKEAQKQRKAKRTVEERIAVAQEVEEEGIVLLKNNGVLPITSGSVCITGAPAHIYHFGGGSSKVLPNRPYMPLDQAFRNLGYDAVYAESINELHGSLTGMGYIRGVCRACEDRDVTVFTVGTGAEVEVEATDRPNITYSPEIMDTLRYLRKHSKKLVVVVYAGSVTDLSAFDKLADAVVLAGFGGQNVSQAVANVLTGKVNPSGRLTETYVYSIDDVPAEKTHKSEYCMVYSEGVNVGYRYYETYDVPVLYPFGYGLGYSEFVYSHMKAEKKDGKLLVSFQIENTGDMDGKEVVQLYVHECHPYVYRPVRELKAFDKVPVKAHEKKQVTLELNADAFSYYSTALDAWHMDEGKFCIEIGKNAHDILLSEQIELQINDFEAE